MTTTVINKSEIGNAFNTYALNSNCLGTLRYTELRDLSLVCKLFNDTIREWLEKQGGTASASPIWEHFFKVEGMAFVEGSFVNPEGGPAGVRPRDLKSDFRTLFRNAIGITRFSHFGEPVYAYPEGSQKWNLTPPSDCVPLVRSEIFKLLNAPDVYENNKTNAETFCMVVVPDLINIRFKQDFPVAMSDGSLYMESPHQGNPLPIQKCVPLTRYNLTLLNANRWRLSDPRPDDYQYWKDCTTLDKVSVFFIRYDIPEQLRGKSGPELQECLPPHLAIVPKTAGALLINHRGLFPSNVKHCSEEGWYKDLICLNPYYVPRFIGQGDWFADFLGGNEAIVFNPALD